MLNSFLKKVQPSKETFIIVNDIKIIKQSIADLIGKYNLIKNIF